MFIRLGLTPLQKVAAPMHFTPGQLRTTVGLSVETYRHWRRVLPAFVKRRGHAPCYSTGDLLAASMLRCLTEGCAVRVGNLADISTEIIRQCNSTSWVGLEGSVLVIDMDRGQCRIVKQPLDTTDIGLSIVCPLDPVLSELRDALLRTQPAGDQTHLKFPLAEVGSGSSAKRRCA